MNIEDLKQLKKQSGLTNAEISEFSGIPVSTINKIFSGATQNPRYATLLAIEEVLATKKKIPFTYDDQRQEPVLIRENAVPYCYTARQYEERDIEQLSEYVRAELIRGRLYMMSAPSRMHQFLVSELLFVIQNHIRSNRGRCHVYPSPFDVRLFGDDSTVVQPDLSIICNREILTDRGCSGAPDWVIEIISKSNSPHDYVTKLMQYQKAGVREYWIIDPFEREVFVYNFENPKETEKYSYEVPVPSGVLHGLQIRIADFEERF